MGQFNCRDGTVVVVDSGSWFGGKAPLYGRQCAQFVIKPNYDRVQACRRPNLPYVQSPNSEASDQSNAAAEPDVSLPNSARTITKNHHRRETITVESQQITLVTEIRRIFDELEKKQELSEKERFTEAKNWVYASVSGKEKEWMAALERYEKDKVLKAQVCDLKLAVSHRTAAKAEAFYKICEECGIDIERVLKRDGATLQKLQAMDTSSRSNSPESEKEMLRLTQERDSLADEVRSLENNYSNLFKLYEKMRDNCLQLKTTEVLRKDVSDQSKKYNSLYILYNELLNNAQEKLHGADMEIKRIDKENEDKTLGIRLSLKRAQIQIKTLETALQSKNKENEELNKICNELLTNREA
uniref:Transforming acidic coiled-coil-containing protein C-terminal domain-containing protein n=1 Tax=Ditylenchus dipsaci TaxID=166011 RepID=A0A915E6P9_9BILA